jgi:hypothetical protein
MGTANSSALSQFASWYRCTDPAARAQVTSGLASGSLRQHDRSRVAYTSKAIQEDSRMRLSEYMTTQVDTWT